MVKFLERSQRPQKNEERVAMPTSKCDHDAELEKYTEHARKAREAARKHETKALCSAMDAGDALIAADDLIAGDALVSGNHETRRNSWLNLLAMSDSTGTSKGEDDEENAQRSKTRKSVGPQPESGCSQDGRDKRDR